MFKIFVNCVFVLHLSLDELDLKNTLVAYKKNIINFIALIVFFSSRVVKYEQNTLQKI